MCLKILPKVIGGRYTILKLIDIITIVVIKRIWSSKKSFHINQAKPTERKNAANTKMYIVSILILTCLNMAFTSTVLFETFYEVLFHFSPSVLTMIKFHISTLKSFYKLGKFHSQSAIKVDVEKWHKSKN